MGITADAPFTSVSNKTNDLNVLKVYNIIKKFKNSFVI